MSGTGFGRFAQFPNGQDYGSDHLGILSSYPFKVNAPQGNPNLIADVAKEHGLPT